MSVRAQCPSCGAEIKWQVATSVVTMCEYCHSAIARGDRTIEQLGKLGDITDLGSRVALGLRGHVGRVGLTVVGRAQLSHPLGGRWDEWYAALDDGRWAWLAEAQGQLSILFAQPYEGAAPTFDELSIGQPVRMELPVALQVVEKSEAKAIGAEGELPFRPTPGASSPFADLVGPGDVFATLDYGESPPQLFVGHQTSPEALGFKVAAAEPGDGQRIKAVELACPHCRGPLEVRAPRTTERLACPSCGGLLDVENGRLRFLQALKPPPVAPQIALGSKGTLRRVELQVIGFLERSVHEGGVRYAWHEYLLWTMDPRGPGFRWLVESNGHWSLCEPLPRGAVSSGVKNVKYNDRTFRRFQEGAARVDYVAGEFYWKIEAGEEVMSTDFVAPPLMLSLEESGSELNWTVGHWLPASEVEQAFGVKLGGASGIAPHQPCPTTPLGRVWLGLTVAALAITAMLFARPSHTVFEENYNVEPVAAGATTSVLFSEPFDLAGHQNIRVRLAAPVNNTWAYVEGDLIDEATGLVQTFALPIEYYTGRDSDGAWSEGTRFPTQFLPALPAGSYTLRLEVQREHANQPLELHVRIDQRVLHVTHLLLLLAGLLVFPVLGVFRRFMFEKQRWADSPYSPYAGSS
jgi:hypothetical protein